MHMLKKKSAAIISRLPYEILLFLLSVSREKISKQETKEYSKNEK